MRHDYKIIALKCNASRKISFNIVKHKVVERQQILRALKKRLHNGGVWRTALTH